MNPQISFSTEEIKENLCTPKFPKNKSIYSQEKEETTLDTLKQTKAENKTNNNFYMSQFSFDEKSPNFIIENNNNESNNINNIIIKDNEENDLEIKYINKLSSDDNDNNKDNEKKQEQDSNFDYENPLNNDKNPEFCEYEYLQDNFEENQKNNKNNEKINLTPQKYNNIVSNNNDKLINNEKLDNDNNDINDKNKYNSTNKKIKKVLLFSTLIDDEINNKISNKNHSTEKNTNSNYLTNTNFTSNENNKINNTINEKISIKPFILENNPKRKIVSKNNIIKDITLSYYNKKRYSITTNNSSFGLNNNNNKIIYEKNLSIEEPRSFSISHKEKNNIHMHSKSRNYDMNMHNTCQNRLNKYKNCVILLKKNRKNLKNIIITGKTDDELNINKTSKNYDYSKIASQKKSIDKHDKNIEIKTSINSPFRKSKIKDLHIAKNSSYKNYIISENINTRNNASMKHRNNKISTFSFNDNNEKNIQNMKIQGYSTERNFKVKIDSINVYSKKVIYIPNANNNKIYRNSVINKVSMIPKEKNMKTLFNEKNNENKIKSKEYFNEILSKININKTISNTSNTKKQIFNIKNNNTRGNKINKVNKNKEYKIRNVIHLCKFDTNKKTITNKNINNKNNNNKNDRIINRIIFERLKNNILHYSINRNNKNNKIKNEVSIFIGEKNNKENEKKTLLQRYKTGKLNKKTIINVNQYYSSYYIKK